MKQPDGNRWIKVAAGIAVSIAMIWFAFRGRSLGEIWTQIATMKPLPMLAAVILATLPFPLRVPRWSLLLRSTDGSSIPPGKLWHAIAIGFAANNILPLRLGEVIRMGAISRIAPVPFASAFASVAVERIFDALTAMGLLAGALLVIDLPAGNPLAEKVWLVGIAALLALGAAVVVALRPTIATRPITAILPEGTLRSGILGIIERLVEGLAALGDWRRALPLVGWSLAIWLTNAAAFWLAFAAFGIEASFAAALVLQGALMIGIAVPSSPGYAGVFETAIMLTLSSLFGVPEEVGLAYALTYHVLTFVPITLLGVHSLLTTGLSFRQARESAT